MEKISFENNVFGAHGHKPLFSHFRSKSFGKSLLVIKAQNHQSSISLIRWFKKVVQSLDTGLQKVLIWKFSRYSKFPQNLDKGKTAGCITPLYDKAAKIKSNYLCMTLYPATI